jgi:hypothetical protein
LRTFLVIAMVANSLDLVATTFGIHWFGNAEGNPLLAPLAHNHWWAFVLFKGVVVPFLIWHLFRQHRRYPRLVPVGFAIVNVALAVALGQWAGWMAGVMATSPLGPR